MKTRCQAAIATIALTRGSRSVLATTSELADDPLASRFLNGVLHRLPAAAMPVALREMTRRFLADPGTMGTPPMPSVPPAKTAAPRVGR